MSFPTKPSLAQFQRDTSSELARGHFYRGTTGPSQNDALRHHEHVGAAKSWNPIPRKTRALLIGGWVATLVWLELRRALRPTRDSKIRRDGRNVEIAALAGAVMQWIEVPVAFRLAELAAQHRHGLFYCAQLPSSARILAAIVLLDYTLYVWHVLTHRLGFLWRFHRVHHIDREMDASTAFRFHFGEVEFSLFFLSARLAFFVPRPTRSPA